MFFFTDQVTIIHRLNAYAQYASLPIRFHDKGMCNGFSTVYAKYRIEGRQLEFYRILQSISKTPTGELTDDARLFAQQILLTSVPYQFNIKLDQITAYQALSIDGKPLKNAFNLAMITNDHHWEQIIQDIKIAEDEVVLVASSTHKVALSMLSGKYEIYDPNDLIKYTIVDNEQQLVDKLRRVFLKKDRALGLSLQLLQHPNSTRQLGFDEKDIIKKFITPENINEVSETKTTLDQIFLTKRVDIDYINMLINFGAKSGKCIVLVSSLTSVVHHQQNVSPPILNRLIELAAKAAIEFTDHKKDLDIVFRMMRLNIFIALLLGKEEIFKLLYDHPSYQAFKVGQTDFDDLVIFAALQAGCEALLCKVINEYKARTPDANKRFARFMSNKMIEEYTLMTPNTGYTLRGKERFDRFFSSTKLDLIEQAIIGDSPACLSLILNELKEDRYELNDEQKLRYLSKAIHANNYHMVRIIVSIIPSEPLKALRLPLSLVEQTTLAILKLLQSSGVPFSNNAKNVITRKETQTIGIVSWILIILELIIEKISDYLLNNTIISDNTTMKDYLFNDNPPIIN